MRLDKFLADKGLGTRKDVRGMVKSGRVLLNGAAPLSAAVHITPETDCVALDGVPIEMKTAYHLMLFKPEGVLTAARDKKQKTVMDLLPPLFAAAGCMPIGRLDKDTTGLLLFTTDGQLSHLLLSPKRRVEKVYRASVKKALTPLDAEAFSKGLKLSDFTALPAELNILSPFEARVTVFEGKFHQIKRMFESLGNEVTALHRESFGGIALDETLAKGGYRELTEDEVARLRRTVE